MPAVPARSKVPRSADGSTSASNDTRSKLRGLPRHEAPRSWSTLGYGLLGSLLLWLALPPVGWWPLAWAAPIPWLMLARRPELPGRRPYVMLWFAGLAFWLGALHWLRLPHPATSMGWLALSSYLAFYLPTFLALVRTAVHRFRWSLLAAAPIAWTGLELAQAHLLTGINIATPGHSQFRWITLLQISDLCGGYGVSFLILFVAACLARTIPLGEQRRKFTYWPLVPAGAALAAVLAYGEFRMRGEHTSLGLKIALIQGSVDTQMKTDPAQTKQVHAQYLGLTDRAVRAHADLDLIVWPETMYREPLLRYTDNVAPPADADWTVPQLKRAVDGQQIDFVDLTHKYKVPLLLGMDTIIYGPEKLQRYNSAVLLDRQGNVVDRYDKMRPVMFGEYVPLGSYWPWLYRLTPLADGIQVGTVPKSLPVGRMRIAPSICFETLLPHFIRGQVAELRAAGAEPDLLVNLTNDGWFWGSSELDLHLMCGVMRAVECRKPLAIAANTGFSAFIDADGRILAQGPRRETGVLVLDVPADTRRSLYVAWGDLGAGACLAWCAIVGTAGLWPRLRRWRRGD